MISQRYRVHYCHNSSYRNRTFSSRLCSCKYFFLVPGLTMCADWWETLPPQSSSTCCFPNSCERRREDKSKLQSNFLVKEERERRPSFFLCLLFNRCKTITQEDFREIKLSDTQSDVGKAIYWCILVMHHARKCWRSLKVSIIPSIRVILPDF